MTDHLGHGLGRRYAPDPRDRPFAAVLPPRAASQRTYRYWNDTQWHGNQGAFPRCVAYASLHWVHDGPITHPTRIPALDPIALYDAAQEADEWPGTDYDGTSVRAGFKILQRAGLVGPYAFTRRLDEVVEHLLERGPVVIGSSWYPSMSTPDRRGHIRIGAGDTTNEGHAYELNGVSRLSRRVRVKQSWGQSWGYLGHAWLDFDTLARLLAENGEACIATEAA